MSFVPAIFAFALYACAAHDAARLLEAPSDDAQVIPPTPQLTESAPAPASVPVVAQVLNEARVLDPLQSEPARWVRIFGDRAIYHTLSRQLWQVDLRTGERRAIPFLPPFGVNVKSTDGQWFASLMPRRAGDTSWVMLAHSTPSGTTRTLSVTASYNVSTPAVNDGWVSFVADDEAVLWHPETDQTRRFSLSGGSRPRMITSVKGEALILSSANSTGDALGRFDASGTMVRELWSGSLSEHFVTHGASVLFQVRLDPVGNATGGYALYFARNDTSDAPVRVADNLTSSHAANPRVSEQTLCFTSEDGAIYLENVSTHVQTRIAERGRYCDLDAGHVGWLDTGVDASGQATGVVYVKRWGNE